MDSYDITVDSTQNWYAIVNTGTYSIVQLVHSNKAGATPVLRCRYGATSTSGGFNLHVDDVIQIDRTLYVKAHNAGRDVTTVSYTVNITPVN